MPPGKWGFFAAVRLPGRRNIVLAAWTDFRQRVSGETIRLTPAQTKHWELRLPDGSALVSKGVFVKPPEFPIWIAAPFSPATGSLTMAVSGGDLQLWTTGDATRHQPGFVLSLGTVSDQTADGQLLRRKRRSLSNAAAARGGLS